MVKNSRQGSKGCPCIDAIETLDPMSDCITVSGLPGKKSSKDHSKDSICYPISYGSMGCKAHDAYTDPSCTGNISTDSSYCNEKWCYVDVEKCKTSTEVVLGSTYFNDLDLYYSYSTCNSSATANIARNTHAFSKYKKFTATIPGSYYPHHFKFTEDGKIAAFNGPEYYNNSIPFHGSLIDYLDRVVGSANNIEEIKYEFRSKASDVFSPMSAFSATVRDVQMRLTDMAGGPFWVTSERLGMTSFTSPIATDKVLLVVPEPEEDRSFKFQVERIMSPFDAGLWILLLLTIIAVSALSLWFASPKDSNKGSWLAFRNEEWKRANWLKKAYIFSRHLLEAFLQKGMFCFGASVEQDLRASLPHKLLMFGFSFLIVISVSAYVAELAAILTKSGVSDYIDSMEKAIAANAKICAHPTSKDELRSAWPEASFVFNDKTADYPGVLEMYDSKKCSVIAASNFISHDVVLMDQFCDRKLKFTKGVAIEVPIAFPVKDEIAAGLSHLLYDMEKNLRLSYYQLYRSYKPDLKCHVDLALHLLRKKNNPEPLTSRMMIYPYVVLLVCAGAAVLIKFCHRRIIVKAAAFLARVANLDKSTSETILDIVSFAHLDVDYDEDSGFGSDPNKMTNNQKRNYLRRISQRLSISLAQNHGSTFFKEAGSSDLDHWEVKNEITRAISNRLLDIEKNDAGKNVNPSGVCGPASNDTKINQHSALKSSHAISPRKQLSGVKFNEESLIMNESHPDSSLDHINTTTKNQPSNNFFSSNESSGIPRLRSSNESSPLVALEDTTIRAIVHHLTTDSRALFKEIVKESVEDAMEESHCSQDGLEGEISHFKDF